ncbi:hypothetical protein OsJ_31045 [Oryza sativa Japonica Group]|uniref:Uncharacterized protein n=1 Tax=Oryza sativa subsp. japonica TaxID=39947 RepID=B9G7Z8_ORYSJ|nr:hypothetical protein OsJ_31045 [Oryza sativa Japonica Group]
MSLLPFHFFFSLDSPLLPQAAAAQARPAPGRRPAGAPCRRRLGPVVVVLILVVGALFLILGPTGSSSFTMPRIRTEFNEPVHVAVAAPPSAADADASRRQHERRGGQWPSCPTTSASALTARSSCSTSSRRRASPPGLNPGPIPFGGPRKNLPRERAQAAATVAASSNGGQRPTGDIGWRRRRSRAAAVQCAAPWRSPPPADLILAISLRCLVARPSQPPLGSSAPCGPASTPLLCRSASGSTTPQDPVSTSSARECQTFSVASVHPPGAG